MSRQSATAFAPASVGNVGVGFDMLGLALHGVGDSVVARRVSGQGFSLKAIEAEGDIALSDLPADVLKNTAAIAASALWRGTGQTGGLELTLTKGIPLQSGMGGSAASAVAAVMATNALLDNPLPVDDLLSYAMEGEAFASGGIHADNVAPSLFGGLVFCPPAMLPGVFKVPTPSSISCVLLHPELSVNTAQSRRNLAKTYSLEQWVEQQSYAMGFILACCSDDHELLKRSLVDVLIEPQRKGEVACFDAVQKAALDTGALGCSLSGSGPSIFAFAPTALAHEIAAAMLGACESANTVGQTWIGSLNAPGARVIDD